MVILVKTLCCTVYKSCTIAMYSCLWIIKVNNPCWCTVLEARSTEMFMNKNFLSLIAPILFTYHSDQLTCVSTPIVNTTCPYQPRRRFNRHWSSIKKISLRTNSPSKLNRSIEVQQHSLAHFCYPHNPSCWDIWLQLPLLWQWSCQVRSCYMSSVKLHNVLYLNCSLCHCKLLLRLDAGRRREPRGRLGRQDLRRRPEHQRLHGSLLRHNYLNLLQSQIP